MNWNKYKQTYLIELTLWTSQVTKIPKLVTMVSTPNNAAITDSTINEDPEDEDTLTKEN